MPDSEDEWPWPFQELGWSLVLLIAGSLMVAYPILVFRNLGGWGGALVARVTGGMGLLAGIVLVISGGAGLARVIRKRQE
jgi:hypothetical protein